MLTVLIIALIVLALVAGYVLFGGAAGPVRRRTVVERPVRRIVEEEVPVRRRVVEDSVVDDGVATRRYIEE